MLKQLAEKFWGPKRLAEAKLHAFMQSASTNGQFYKGMMAALFLLLLADFLVFGFRPWLLIVFVAMVFAVFLNLRLLK